MNFLRNLVVRNLAILTSLILLSHTDKRVVSAAEPISVFSFIHDLIQYNVAGVPIIHERTEWDFDPDVGKQRRVNYERVNGRHGLLAIERLGMGVGHKGSWGTPV